MTEEMDEKQAMQDALDAFKKLDPEIQYHEYSSMICSKVCMEKIIGVVQSHTMEELNNADNEILQEIFHMLAVFLQQGVRFGFCEEKEKNEDNGVSE